jgi:TolB protein
LARDAADPNSYVRHPFLAPDSKELFYLSSSKEQGQRILRRNLETGAEQDLYRPTGANTLFALSPDGRQLVIAEMPRPTPLPARKSPDGPQIFSFGTGHAVKLVPAAGGEPRELVKAEGIIGALAWTPDGRYVVLQRLFKERTELWRVSAAGGEPEKLDVTLPKMMHLSIHPDGRRIAFASFLPRAVKTEVWVLKNFLPPLKDSTATPAADASAAKSE